MCCQVCKVHAIGHLVNKKWDSIRKLFQSNLFHRKIECKFYMVREVLILVVPSPNISTCMNFLEVSPLCSFNNYPKPIHMFLFSRKIYFLFLLQLFSCCIAFAQAPQAIPYQAVARDVNGNVLSNQAISIQFSIHDSIPTGSIVYQEIQQVTTTSLGLFTCHLGQGTPVVGTFASVNWSNGNKYLQVEMDPSGVTTYTDMGTTQLMSVPYALYAASSNGWTTTGNSGTNDVVNALGTNDATDLVIKTDNFETARLFSNPETGGGLNSPTDRLRLMRTGLVNQKWPMVASFQLGSYEANIEGRTQMDIALLNNSGVYADTKVMSLLANGHVGIGNTAPHAPLQFGNNLLNRKLVLYETNDNDHEFLGLGINPGVLRYQVANAGDSHVFFSGNGASASNELMRITGTGNVGIGTSAPTEQLHTTGGVRFSALSGNSRRTVYVDSTGKLSAGIDSVQSFSVAPNATFNNYAESSITVMGQPVIPSTNIAVHINYQQDNARFFLKSPNGDILNLLSIANGLLIVVDADFTDNGTPIPPNQTTINGTFQPLGDMTVTGGNITPTVSSFAAINGGTINPNGVWTLMMWTTYNFSYGQINNWSISFNSSSNTQGSDYFHTMWLNGALTKTSSIYDNGKVGINTITPQRTLDVHGDIAQGTWTDDLASRRIGVMDATTQTAGMEIENTTLGGNYSQKVHFITHHNASGFGRRLTINEDGYVGIGTTLPVNKLTVAGNTNITGSLGIGITSSNFKLHVAGDDNAIKISGSGGFQQYGQLNFGDANYVYLKEDVDDRLTIRANRIALEGGNVGIGTFNPSTKLSVTGVGGLFVSSTNSGSGTFDWIAGNFGGSSGSRVVTGILNGVATIGGHTSDLSSWTNLSINPEGGRVGIGTNSPSNQVLMQVVSSVTNDNWVAGFANNANTSGTKCNGIIINAGNPAGNNFSNMISFNRPDGVNIGAVGQSGSGSVSFSSTSDKRLKENIHPTKFGLSDLNKIDVKDYDYINGTKDQTGFIAQQLYEIYPFAVSQGGEDPIKNPWMVDYGRVTPLLVKSVQELSHENDAMKKENEQLKSQLNEILRRLNQLEKNNTTIK